MALRDFWAFENLPPLSGSTLATCPLACFRPDVTLVNSPAATVSLAGDGSLQFSQTGNNSSVNTTGISIPYANVSDFTQPQSYIGFRYSNTQSNASFLSQASAAWITNSAGTVQNLVPIPIAASFAQQFIEVMIDRLNKQLVVWIDGTQQAPVSFDFNAFANGAAVTLSIGYRFTIAAINPTSSCALRNIYFVDNTQDNTLCSRLGSVQTLPAPLASVSAPNYVSSDSSTPLADLSSPFTATASTLTAPTLTTPITMDEMVAEVNTSGLPVLNVLAAKMDVSAERTSGAALSFITGATYNGQSKSSTVSMNSTSNAFVYGQKGILIETAPDGTALTPAVLAGVQFTLTPETA
jgi:hypothetical protein